MKSTVGQKQHDCGGDDIYEKQMRSSEQEKERNKKHIHTNTPASELTTQ